MVGTKKSDRFGSIPSIICPVCYAVMRFSTLEAKEDGTEQLTFDCTCGFDYRQSRSAQLERREIERVGAVHIKRLHA